MYDLGELIAEKPIVPYIRECDYAVRKSWVMPERRLLDYLLVYVQDGRCRFKVDGVEYSFRDGDFCLIQPGSLNLLEGLTDTVTPFAHMDIFYQPEREQSFPTRAGQIDLSPYSHLLQPRLNDVYGIEVPVRLQPRHPAKFRDTFLHLVECWQHREPLMQLKAQHAATELVLAIIEEHQAVNQPVRPSPQSINWIMPYLSLHLGEPLSIREMAKRANLSPSRFSALFRQRFGMAPYQYLLELRVNHAKELIETTELSQEEIASYCGFANIHHFSKAFKKKTGRPPGAFRRLR
ncbi:helix-turn-helix domain-containing protein [Cohnella sp. LGH]|uniref:helix-turn-helix domain-containing protein n=1 Tax=Cohnella sp. LGH TaxID=1619153 RepID=UPI001ADB0585|nr:helix-turn-helix domain-containing protein [Cohnella sp. LGH]QTH41367.1 helix-turn-helix domain-containing protein [Cohnella sp. LGH]